MKEEREMVEGGAATIYVSDMERSVSGSTGDSGFEAAGGNDLCLCESGSG